MTEIRTGSSKCLGCRLSRSTTVIDLDSSFSMRSAISDSFAVGDSWAAWTTISAESNACQTQTKSVEVRSQAQGLCQSAWWSINLLDLARVHASVVSESIPDAPHQSFAFANRFVTLDRLIGLLQLLFSREDNRIAFPLGFKVSSTCQLRDSGFSSPSELGRLTRRPQDDLRPVSRLLKSLKTFETARSAAV